MGVIMAIEVWQSYKAGQFVTEVRTHHLLILNN